MHRSEASGVRASGHSTSGAGTASCRARRPRPYCLARARQIVTQVSENRGSRSAPPELPRRHLIALRQGVTVAVVVSLALLYRHCDPAPGLERLYPH